MKASVASSPGGRTLVIENVGGADALQVGVQARYEIGKEEVEALIDNDKYKLPLPVPRAGSRERFGLKSVDNRASRLFLRLSWKNRAGKVEKRSIGLQP